MLICIEAFLLTVALSVDSLATAVSYGINKSKITVKTAAIISVVCTLLLAVGITAGGVLNRFIPLSATEIISCAVLVILGLFKLLFTHKEEEINELSLKETLVLAFGMSIDGAAAGIGTGVAEPSRLFALTVCSLPITFASLFIGNRLGLRLGKKLPPIFGRLGGAALIFIGFSKLI